MYMEIYVHPVHGNDSGNGTQCKPYQTIESAVAQALIAAKSSACDDQCNINIMIGDGINYIPDTIRLIDFPDNTAINFRPWDGMYATLSSAERVKTFEFEKFNDNCYRICTPKHISALYVDGEFAKKFTDIKLLSENSFYTDDASGLMLYRSRNGVDPRFLVMEYAGNHVMFEISGCDVTFESVEFYGGGDEASPYFLCTDTKAVFNRCTFRQTLSPAANCFNENTALNFNGCEFNRVKPVCFNASEGCYMSIKNCYFNLCESEIANISGGVKLDFESVSLVKPVLPVLKTNNDCIVNIKCSRFEFPKERYPVIIAEKTSSVTEEGNCVIVENAAMIDSVYFNTESDDNIVIDRDEWFTYKYIMTTNYDSDEIRRNTAISLLKKAGYRKVIQNYGDII